MRFRVCELRHSTQKTPSADGDDEMCQNMWCGCFVFLALALPLGRGRVSASRRGVQVSGSIVGRMGTDQRIGDSSTVMRVLLRSVVVRRKELRSRIQSATRTLSLRRDKLKHEMTNIIRDMIINYTGQNRTTEQTWDQIQRQMKCCGWISPGNWSENIWISNNTNKLYSCSCRNESLPGTEVRESGLCEYMSAEPPVHETGCIHSVEKWLRDNCGVILGVCVGVAVLELLGMILSMCLCKSVVQEDYAKVPKY